jgi:hypothetical protein
LPERDAAHYQRQTYAACQHQAKNFAPETKFDHDSYVSRTLKKPKKSAASGSIGICTNNYRNLCPVEDQISGWMRLDKN